MIKKTAIVTGITGQDGAYLSKLLVDKGYVVVGLVRSHSSSSQDGLRYLGILENIILEECDLSDISQIIKLLQKYQPSEIYNLAAQSSVGLSFQQPIGTIKFNIISVLNQLEAIKMVDSSIKFYQASSSEMFGMTSQLPITEDLPLNPQSPYAVSKASAHMICKNYRKAYGLYISSGILFNHESYLRRDNFFVKKVISESINIAEGKQDYLKVGDIDLNRDFGYAPRYVEAMWQMLQMSEPDDYIICSGQSISLRSIIHHVFDYLKIDQSKYHIDNELFRPAEIIDIYGDAAKAKEILNWNYKLNFFDVLDIMIEEEINNRKKENA